MAKVVGVVGPFAALKNPFIPLTVLIGDGLMNWLLSLLLLAVVLADEGCIIIGFVPDANPLINAEAGAEVAKPGKAPEAIILYIICGVTTCA